MKKYIQPFQIIPWVILISILSCPLSWGQGTRHEKKKKIFLRVYNHDGKMMTKGKLINLMDSSIVLYKIVEGGDRLDSIHYSKISFIRKGRSPMHHFVISGAIGFAITVPLVAMVETQAAVNGLLSSALVSAVTGTPIPEPEPSHAIRNGIIVGIITGGISALSHLATQEKIQIDGSFKKFNSARQIISANVD